MLKYVIIIITNMTSMLRHSLTLAYTNTTVIATTSFPVAWPLMAVSMITDQHVASYA